MGRTWLELDGTGVGAGAVAVWADPVEGGFELSEDCVVEVVGVGVGVGVGAGLTVRMEAVELEAKLAVSGIVQL